MYTNFKTYVLSTVGDASPCPENECTARLLSAEWPQRALKKVMGVSLTQLWPSRQPKANFNFDAQGTPGYAELQRAIAKAILGNAEQCHRKMMPRLAKAILGNAELQCHRKMISLNLNVNFEPPQTRGGSELQCHPTMISLRGPSLPLLSLSVLHKASPQVEMRSCSAIRR